MTQRKSKPPPNSPPDPEPEFEPEGESLADELIGSDPEPEDGWLNFDENGKRIPSSPLPPQPKPAPATETSGRPEPPPPGLGDFSKFISDGSDIRVGSDVK